MIRIFLKGGNLMAEKLSEQICFVHSFGDFVQKTCQKLPFSNILLLATDVEFFEFGFKIYNLFLEKGNKVETVIIKDKNLLQLQDFFKAKDTISEFRGVIVFNKQFLCHILSGWCELPNIFYLHCSSDIYGIFESNNKTQVEYYFYLTDIDKNDILKCIAIRTLCLIDYVFYINLTKLQIDQQFFSALKRTIVLSITALDNSEENNKKLFRLSFIIEKFLSHKAEIRYFSATVSSYLMKNNLYDLEVNFMASKLIIKKYKALLKNKFQSQISFSERAKLVSFFSKNSINCCLDAMRKQLDRIKDNIMDKQEIKSLIKAYDKLVSFIDETVLTKNNEKDKRELIENHKLNTCVSVCGDTNLSINGMTWARQMSFMQYV